MNTLLYFLFVSLCGITYGLRIPVTARSQDIASRGMNRHGHGMKHNGPGVRMWQAKMDKGKNGGKDGNKLATAVNGTKENVNNAKDVVVRIFYLNCLLIFSEFSSLIFSMLLTLPSEERVSESLGSSKYHNITYYHRIRYPVGHRIFRLVDQAAIQCDLQQPDQYPNQPYLWYWYSFW